MSSPVTIVKRKRSPFKITAWVVAGALLLAILASCAVSIYVGWNLTHPVKEALSESPADYGLSYEEAEFTSLEGDILLKGWYMPAADREDPMTLIIAHGYRNNREYPQVGTLDLSKRLIAKGYNVLVFDFRNSGESEGNMTSVGEFEKYDLLAAIDWVKHHHPSSIGLIGFSMGGSTALLAAAEDPDVKGVVADSPFSNLYEYLERNLPVWSDLPDFPFTPLILSLLPPITGINPHAASPIDVLDEIYPRPVLFIHSETDDKIPYTESVRMAEQYPDRFELWRTADAGHADSYLLDQVEYVERLAAFFEPLR
ncbi:alpha/beta fold hydrolase [Xylanibacillus composti]|uniref:Alpha/beta hydrolase n=1 Tax=Xylanibacillus composti TaxID=1572762 RepID=A0A8J4M292_9BACL|nr:alpha/beta fold hydrolase [Xylanibacillus composti]MDT9724199.1 alpha/beta fold hydrolase [Xylanibacillus composti]GIQ68286.1 alpha/beta hydrolase [Xylanibacillus composti]